MFELVNPLWGGGVAGNPFVELGVFLVLIFALESGAVVLCVFLELTHFVVDLIWDFNPVFCVFWSYTCLFE